MRSELNRQAERSTPPHLLDDATARLPRYPLMAVFESLALRQIELTTEGPDAVAE